MHRKLKTNLAFHLPRKSFQRPPRWPEPTMNFVIAYDIADPKRLKKVAKELESFARRVQYSVFIFSGSRRDLQAKLSRVIQEMDIAVDRLQAWPVRTSTKSSRIDIGAALPDTAVALVMGETDFTMIEAMDDNHRHEHLLID
jgi:CRISPR-associated protein Cas2